MPTTYWVNSTGDQPDPTPNNGIQDDCDPNTPGNQYTLRGAIQTANSHTNQGGADIIRFAIGNGRQSINIGSALPALGAGPVGDSIIIDGTPPNQYPNQVIVLDGVNAGNQVNGLTITTKAAGSTIRGMTIVRFTDAGVFLESGDGNKILGNFLGHDDTGEIDIGKAGNNFGIYIASSDDNVIGGDINSTRESNVIACNKADGIWVNGGHKNKIFGNYIGTFPQSSAITFPLGNGRNGVFVNKANDTQIGGEEDKLGNVISQNKENGIRLIGSTNGTLIRSNRIGTNLSGTTALPNIGNGILIDVGPTNNHVGGATAVPGQVPGNVISGNKGFGIMIRRASANDVEGNVIGTSKDGKTLSVTSRVAFPSKVSPRTTIESGGTRIISAT